MIIKINNLLAFKIIIVSIFIFNYAVREKFIYILKDINVLFFIALAIFGYVNKKNISRKMFILIGILFFYNISINIITGSRINNVIYFNIQTILPLLLFVIDFSKGKKISKKEIQEIINFYNFFIHIFFLIFILDFITNNEISKLLTKIFTIYPDTWIPDGILNNRYHFFFAHPLYSSVLVMIYYVTNITCYRKGIQTNIKYWIFHIISMMLLFSFGSKTAIVLFLSIFCFYNFTPKKLIVGFLFMAILYFSGNMNFILKRFILEGIKTSGRNESIVEAIKYGLIKIRLFNGEGENLQYLLTRALGTNKAGAIEEYPFFVFVLRYGIFYALLLSNVLFFKPLIQFFKLKNFILIIGTIIIILEINMFNGLVALVEVEIVYIMFILFMQHINFYLKYKTIGGKEND